ncbi:hypothetical protein [Bacteroides cellulosilyticus]|jgi:hypothetical protein|uniref:hypothetical protein n=1 Tax=Bacteroides cellulosilyticus TaxID=246787 RepID=UPI0032EC4712
MKAIIKETGETVEVTRIETKRIEGTLKGEHEIFYPKDLEIPGIDADWEQRRYELVKAAMQGYCANSLDYVVRTANAESIAQWSISTANAVISQLKEGDEWNEFKDWYNGAIYGEHCIFRYEAFDNGNIVSDYITAVWNDCTCDYIDERLGEYFTDYKITHWKTINKPKGEIQ